MGFIPIEDLLSLDNLTIRNLPKSFSTWAGLTQTKESYCFFEFLKNPQITSSQIVGRK